MGKVLAVCISAVRGVQKENQGAALFIAGYGLDGDAHAGDWHRQVSLLSADEIAAFNARGAAVEPGAFGENLVVEGIDFRTLPVGTLLRCGDVLLEVTQIGKACHHHCAIFHKMGDCIMPREGIFARVLEGGRIAAGDEMTIIPRETPLPLQAAVITLSDRCAAGERQDESGPAVGERLQQAGYTVIERRILPDGREGLTKELIRLADQRQPDLILTTGGTGFAPRDLTPEATLDAAERLAPGIAEAMRAASLRITPRAMLTRAVSVIRGRTLIINLPGSPKACMECMDVFLDQLPHAHALLRGEPMDCAR
nr:MOSC domain-containing protein [uncultured Agathobaculum sp.]